MKAAEEKKNNAITVLILLSLAALISSAVTLCIVLPRAGDEDADVVIDAGSGDKVVTINTRENSSDDDDEDSSVSAAAKYAADHPGLKVKDENGTIWTSKKESIELFKASYLGADGYSVTVASSDVESVAAPGTGNSYDFDVINTGKGVLGYYVTLETKTSGGMYIPLDIRLMKGSRYIEDEINLPMKDGWYNFDEVTDLYDEGSLSVKEKATYTVDWVWPYGSAWQDIDHDYEGAEKIGENQDKKEVLYNGIRDTDNTENTTAQDEWDTLLGNMAVKTDLTVTVDITVVAWSKGTGGSGAKTGDKSRIIIWILAFLASLLALSLIWLLIKRRRRAEDMAAAAETDKDGSEADGEQHAPYR